MARNILTLALLLVAGAVNPAEQHIVCPAEISEPSIRLTNLPKQWQPYVASPLYLSSAGAAAGPPEQLATLKGDSTWRRGSTKWSTTYDLSDDSFAAGKWMECRYGEYGEVMLSTRLNDKIKTCTVRFSKGEKVGQRSIKIDCH